MLKNALATVFKYRQFYDFARPYLGWIVVAGVVTSLVGGMDAAMAWVLRPFMDAALSQDGSSSYLIYAPLAIILFTVLQGTGKLASNYLALWISSRIIMDIKGYMFEKLLHNEAAFFDRSTSGLIQIAYNQDVDTACHGVYDNGKTLVLYLASTVSLVAVLFYNSWQLATIALLFLLLAVYPATRIRKKMRQVFSKDFQIGGKLLTHFNEAFNGNRVVGSYNMNQALVAKLRATMTEQYGLALQLLRRGGSLSIFMHFMVALGVAFVIWLHRYLASSENMTLGNFVSFIAALLLLYTPVKNIGSNLHSFYGSYMAVERLVANMNRVPAVRDRPDARDMRPFSTEIRFKDVGFAYRPDNIILDSFNLTVRKGEVVALVGESGAGKSTVASLLARFYDVTAGEITVDGADIRDLRLESLRNMIAVVFQDNFLFDGTIRDNILVGRPGASQREIDDAVDAACLRAFISNLKEGVDTRIGERGILLSGGEKQRVAIARAFIKNAPIVILDEATSSLDNKSEAIVQRAIENLESDKTVLIIAHRLSTIVNADRIIVMEHGKVVESGRHDELVAVPNGVYAKLYHLQSAERQNTPP